MTAQIFKPRQWRRRRIPDRQDDSVGVHGVSMRKSNLNAARRDQPEVEHLVPYPLEAHMRRRVAFGPLQQILQIIAVQRTGQKILGVGPGQSSSGEVEELLSADNRPAGTFSR
jgi:hypothetical protein